MASINGIELKNIKERRNHEDFVIYDADIFVEGIKIGSFYESYTGGPMDIQIRTPYDIEKLKDKILETNKDLPYYFQNMKDEDDRSLWSKNSDDVLEFLLYDILKLNKWEKVFKENIENDYSSLIFITDGYHEYCYAFDSVDSESIIKYAKTLKLEFYDTTKPTYHVFSKLNDFDIYPKIYLRDIESRIGSRCIDGNIHDRKR